MVELEKDISALRSGLKSVEAVSDTKTWVTHTVTHSDLHDNGPLQCWSILRCTPQELKFQQTQSSLAAKDKFVSVVSQFITVASFSFSEVEESFLEAKQVVSGHNTSTGQSILQNTCSSITFEYFIAATYQSYKHQPLLNLTPFPSGKLFEQSNNRQDDGKDSLDYIVL